MDRTPEKFQPPTPDVLALGVPSSLVFDDDPLAPLLNGDLPIPPTPASVTELWLRGLDRSDDCERAFLAVLVKHPETIKDQELLEEAERCLRRALDRCESKVGAAFASYLSALGRIVESKQQLGEAEGLYREALELQEKILGERHEATIASGLRLFSLLEKTDRKADAQRLQNVLQARSVTGADEYWQQNRLRAIALDMFLAGQYAEAEGIYRRLADKGFELCSTHCHLARVYLVLDREAEARKEVEHACELRVRSPAYAIVRMLYLKTLLEMLGDSEWKPSLLELKQALATPAAHMDWKMRPVLEHLQPRLGQERYDLMSAVIAAICESSKLPELESNPLWQSVCGVPTPPSPPSIDPIPVPAVTRAVPQVAPPDDAPTSEEVDQFTFGKVVKVSGETVTVKAYSYTHDADIESEYRCTERTEFGNIAKLADLTPGDDVVLNFIESQGQPLLVALVKETTIEPSAPNVASNPLPATNPSLPIL